MNINDHRDDIAKTLYAVAGFHAADTWETETSITRGRYEVLAEGLLASPALARLLAAARDEARAEAAREARERGDIGQDGGPEVWDWLEGINRRAARARGEVA